ncbi:UDP-2,4-diacetamido-2,4,6-trideoxy-beta-L-altropyranose hydrolase [Saccharobesus litoralis]|nr:UDP-2,4-diacetamido-2,4,6-trideoxy-beta-L-altropyranose hydrolase [Saccharobesus litoralis]
MVSDKPCKTVLIRVDATATIGAGHFVRCIALAQGLTSLGVNVVFVCIAESVDFINALHDFPFQYVTIDSDGVDEINYLAEQYNSKLVVIDGYQFSSDYRLALQKENYQLIAIDDNNDGGNLFADLIINPTVYKDNQPDYSDQKTMTNQPVKVIAGEEYRLLRSEITDIMPIEWSKRSGIGVILGGSDPKSLTIPVVKALTAELNKLGIQPDVEVFIGAAVVNPKGVLEELKRLKQNYTYLTWVQNPVNIGEKLAQKQLVISASGGTQFELYALAVPAILLIVANNQFANSQIAQQQGWAKVLDVRNDFSISDFDIALTQMLSANTLVKSYQNMPKYGDDGALNCALVIKKQFLD